VSFEELERAQQKNQRLSMAYRDYFRAYQTNRNTSVMAPPAFRRTYFTAVPFSRMACQVLSERIEIDSVSATSEAATAHLRGILKKLGGADFVAAAHLTAMEYGRSYLVPTGSDEEDAGPGVQVVPGIDMVHKVDPVTGVVLEALRVYGSTRLKRAYYTPAATIYYDVGAGNKTGWIETSRTPTVDGRIPVFPLICRGEPDNPWGRPEAKDVFTLQDAGCRIATDLAIASATMAVPQRTLLGAESTDFQKMNPDGTIQKDDKGNPVYQTADELYMARLLVINDSAAKIAEYSAAQLQNFTTALNAVTRQAAAVLGIPQSVFGVASDSNPASGDAIRQDDARLIRRAEQLTRGFEPAWVGLFEYLLVASPFGFEPVTIRWVDPALPNLAAMADQVSKLASVMVDGRPLYTWRELRLRMGDPVEEVDQAQDDFERDQITQAITQPGGSPGEQRNAPPGP
jgi:hypothetical protein